MPSDCSFDFKREFLDLTQSLKQCFKTAELFGEEDFALAPPLRYGTASLEDREQKLHALYRKFENCHNCALSLTRKKIVFGMGSFYPQVLFVGEGPGYEEDKTGLPFVGRAGELLDKILKAIGLDRNKVYISNIVKCHPIDDVDHPEMRGNDRPPQPSEIEACRTILDQQIEILEPPVLCALGETAAKVLLQTEESISRLRGKVYDFQYPVSKKTVPLLPTYHPAALLRDELLKKDVWTDMKLLRAILTQI